MIYSNSFYYYLNVVDSQEIKFANSIFWSLHFYMRGMKEMWNLVRKAQKEKKKPSC